jgi:hypothetical protein
LSDVNEITNNKNYLTYDEQIFMKNILVVNDQFNNYFQQKIINLPNKFDIIHF